MAHEWCVDTLRTKKNKAFLYIIKKKKKFKEKIGIEESEGDKLFKE